jgi:hypothetical protein
MMYVGTAFLPGWLVDLYVVLSDPLALVRCSGSLMRVQFGILAAVAAALLVPQAAEAASLAPLGACYRSLDSEKRETVPVWGMDFTPGEHVDVYVDGELAQQDVTVLADGTVRGEVRAPYQPSGERGFTIVVAEDGQPSNTATATSRVTALALRLKPQRAAPSRRVRFIGSGFTDGPMVYAHYVRKGKHRKTVELGAPQGPCGRISAKRRQIPVKRPALGRWTLQVDNQPTYSAEPAGVFVRLAITVRRVARIGGY